MPESFEYAKNGGRKYLFHNLGGGRFEEVSAQLGIQSRRWALAAVAADLRGTGYPDLFIANDYGVSETVFQRGRQAISRSGQGDRHRRRAQERHERGGRRCAESGPLRQSTSRTSPKRACWCRATTSGCRGRARPGESIRYENMANAMGVELGGWSFGAQFGDFNNDGFLDLYVVNGNVSLDRNRSYWYDYSKVAGGNKAIISDAANWPPLDWPQPVRLSAKASMDERWRGTVQGGRATGRRDGRVRRRVRGAGGFRKSRRAGRGGGEPERPAVALPEYGFAGEPVDRVRTGRQPKQSERHRRGGARVLERPAASAGSLRRQRLLRAEPAASALRLGQGRRYRSR